MEYSSNKLVKNVRGECLSHLVELQLKREQLRLATEEALKSALTTGDPAGEQAQKSATCTGSGFAFFIPSTARIITKD